jgi:prepilin-type N-terminal cleavage/methylation domain-containing protein
VLSSNTNPSGHYQEGYTFIEVLVVISILAVLFLIFGGNVFNQKERGYLARANGEFNVMRSAVNLFVLDNGDYPADVTRNIPPGLEDYVQPNDLDRWPSAPWPGSVYDYDAYQVGGVWAFQISIRFCEVGRPDTCQFPKTEWAEDFGVNSSVYFCFEGPCKAHPNMPANYPGYCVNCNNATGSVFN